MLPTKLRCFLKDVWRAGEHREGVKVAVLPWGSPLEGGAAIQQWSYAGLQLDCNFTNSLHRRLAAAGSDGQRPDGPALLES